MVLNSNPLGNDLLILKLEQKIFKDVLFAYCVTYLKTYTGICIKLFLITPLIFTIKQFDEYTWITYQLFVCFGNWIVLSFAFSFLQYTWARQAFKISKNHDEQGKHLKLIILTLKFREGMGSAKVWKMYSSSFICKLSLSKNILINLLFWLLGQVSVHLMKASI